MRIIKFAILALFLALLVKDTQQRSYYRWLNIGYKYRLRQKFTYKRYRYCYKYGYLKLNTRCYFRNGIVILSQKRYPRSAYCLWTPINYLTRYLRCWRWRGKWVKYYDSRKRPTRNARICRWVNYITYKYLRCYYHVMVLKTRRYGYKLRYRYKYATWVWKRYSSKYYKINDYCKWSYGTIFKYLRCYRRRRNGKFYRRYNSKRYNTRKCRNFYSGPYRYLRCWSYYTIRRCTRWGYKNQNIRCQNYGRWRLYSVKKYKRPGAWCKSIIIGNRVYYRCYRWRGDYRQRYRNTYKVARKCTRTIRGRYKYIRCYKHYYVRNCHYYYNYKHCTRAVRYKLYFYKRVTRGNVVCRILKRHGWQWRQCWRWTGRGYRLYLNKRSKRRPYCKYQNISVWRYFRCWRWVGNKFEKYIERRTRRRKLICRKLYDGRIVTKQCYIWKRYRYCYNYGRFKRHRRCYFRNGILIYSQRRRFNKAYCRWTGANKTWRFYTCYRRRGRLYVVYNSRRYRNRRYCRNIYRGAYRIYQCYYLAPFRKCVKYGYKMRYRRCYQSQNWKLYYQKSYKRNYCVWQYGFYKYLNCYKWVGRRLVRYVKNRRYNNLRRCHNLYRGAYRYLRCFYYIQRNVCNRWGYKNYYRNCRKIGTWKSYSVRRYNRPGRFCMWTVGSRFRYYRCYYWRGKRLIKYHQRRYSSISCRRWSRGWWRFYKCSRIVWRTRCSYPYDFKWCTRYQAWKVYINTKKLLKYSCRKTYSGLWEYIRCWRYGRYRVCRRWGRKHHLCYYVNQHRLVKNKRQRRRYCRWTQNRTHKFKKCYIFNRRRHCWNSGWWLGRRRHCKWVYYWKIYFNKAYLKPKYRIRCIWRNTLIWRYRICYRGGKRISTKRYRNPTYCKYTYSLMFKFLRCYRWQRYRYCYKYRVGRSIRRKCVYRTGYRQYSVRRFRKKRYCRWTSKLAYRYYSCYTWTRYRRYCKVVRRRRKCYYRYRYRLTSRRRKLRKRYCINKNIGQWTWRLCYRVLSTRRCRIRIIRVCRRRVCRRRVCRMVRYRCRRRIRKCSRVNVRSKLYYRRKIRRRRYYCASRNYKAYRTVTCYAWRCNRRRRCICRSKYCRRGRRRIRCGRRCKCYTRCVSKYRYVVVSRRRYRRRRYCVNSYSGRWRYYSCYVLKRYRYCRRVGKFRRCYYRTRYRRYYRRRYPRRVWCKNTYRGMWRYYKCYVYRRYKRCLGRGKRRRCRYAYKYFYLRRGRARRGKYCIWTANRYYKYFNCYRLKVTRVCRKSCRVYRRRRICRRKCFIRRRYIRYLRKRYRKKRPSFCRARNIGAWRYVSCYRIIRRKVCRGRGRARRCRYVNTYKLYRRRKYRRKRYCINKNVGMWRYYSCYTRRRVRRCRLVYYLGYCRRCRRKRIRRCRRYRCRKSRRVCKMVWSLVRYRFKRYRRRQYCTRRSRGAWTYVKCYKYRRYRRCRRRRIGKKSVVRCRYLYSYRVYYRRKYRRTRYCITSNRGIWRYVTCYLSRKYKRCYTRKRLGRKYRRCYLRYRTRVISRRRYRRRRYCRAFNRRSYRFINCYVYKKISCRIIRRRRICRYAYKLVSRRVFRRRSYCVNVNRGKFRYYTCYRSIRRYRRCITFKGRKKCRIIVKYKVISRRRYLRKRYCKSINRGQWRWVFCYVTRRFRRCNKRWSKRCAWRYTTKLVSRRRYRRRRFCRLVRRGKFNYRTCYVRRGKKYVVYKRTRLRSPYYCTSRRRGSFRFFRCFRLFVGRRCIYNKKTRKRVCGKYYFYKLARRYRKKIPKKMRKRFCRRYSAGLFFYRIKCWRLVRRVRCWRVRKRRICRKYLKYILYKNKLYRRKRCPRGYVRRGKKCIRIVRKRCPKGYFRRGRKCLRKRRRRSRKYIYRWKKTCKRYRRGRRVYVRCYKYRIRFTCRKYGLFRRCRRDRRYKGRYILIKKRVGATVFLICYCNRRRKRNGGVKLHCRCRRRRGRFAF